MLIHGIKTRVLLVDDEPDFLKVTEKRLRLRGFETETANCGEKALAILRDKSFDVVLLDLAMPGLDGINTLKQIKKDNPEIQILMLSGHATVEKSVEAMKEGAFDFFQKPVDIHYLIEKLHIATEVSRQKLMQRRMAHTEKLASIGTLAAGVAHELNNPLTVILGMADLLIEKTPRDSEQYEILKTIERQGANAKRIVEKLVAFARYSEHDEIEIDVNELIKEVLAVTGKTLSMNRIAVQTDFVDELPPVIGNRGELQQVLMNIMNNAMHAMRGGGILTVTTLLEPKKRDIEIRISDTGPGILKKVRERIFDPFFTTKKVGDGTGLGLSISFGLIKKHKGTIIFETATKDESPQTGTTFIISLPGQALLTSKENINE
jgi:signal transduction histidine kinase